MENTSPDTDISGQGRFVQRGLYGLSQPVITTLPHHTFPPRHGSLLAKFKPRQKGKTGDNNDVEMSWRETRAQGRPPRQLR